MLHFLLQEMFEIQTQFLKGKFHATQSISDFSLSTFNRVQTAQFTASCVGGT